MNLNIHARLNFNGVKVDSFCRTNDPIHILLNSNGVRQTSKSRLELIMSI